MMHLWDIMNRDEKLFLSEKEIKKRKYITMGKILKLRKNTTKKLKIPRQK